MSHERARATRPQTAQRGVGATRAGCLLSSVNAYLPPPWRLQRCSPQSSPPRRGHPTTALPRQRWRTFAVGQTAATMRGRRCLALRQLWIWYLSALHSRPYEYTVCAHSPLATTGGLCLALRRLWIWSLSALHSRPDECTLARCARTHRLLPLVVCAASYLAIGISKTTWNNTS
jgi:hypothetical protein